MILDNVFTKCTRLKQQKHESSTAILAFNQVLLLFSLHSILLIQVACGTGCHPFMDWSMALRLSRSASSPSASHDSVLTKHGKKKTVKKPAAKMSKKPSARRASMVKLLDVGPPHALPLPRLSLHEPECLPCHAWPMPCPIRCGSVCTGLYTEAWALDQFMPAVIAERVFWCESDKNAARFIRSNFAATTSFQDACDPSFYNDAEPVDLLTAGFPCQPFSPAGLQHGMRDARGVVLLAILAYVSRCLPRIVILENVKNLKVSHPEVLVYILETLKSFTNQFGQPVYSTFWKILDSFAYGGVPQQRERLYIVAVKRKPGSAPPKFSWPPPVQPTNLADIFDRGSVKLTSYDNYMLPKTMTKKVPFL